MRKAFSKRFVLIVIVTFVIGCLYLISLNDLAYFFFPKNEGAIQAMRAMGICVIFYTAMRASIKESDSAQ